MDKRIFVLHDTHDSIYHIDGKNSHFYFQNPSDAIIFLKDQLLKELGVNCQDYDNARILNVPLPNLDPNFYWKEEEKEIESRISFKMPLPLSLSDYVLNQRYVLYYDGGSTRTFVIDVKKLL